MDEQIKKGTVLTSQAGIKYKVERYIGAGGQGEVYELSGGGKPLALKWYFTDKSTESQKKIIDNLIDKGCPDDSFLWPQDLIFTKLGERFGYVMPLRPKEYKSIIDLMKARINPSFLNISKAAYNLTKGYQTLHKMGYCYSDISWGNVFFNPDDGKVLICDNDNVTVNGLFGSHILGTPKFMAPEIVIGATKPSRNTDLFSLAVLLFLMFVVNHPLDGEQVEKIHCFDPAAMTKVYGTNPIFIFDKYNKNNRPVKGINDNADIYWPLLPKDIQDLFEKSFTIGLKEANKRVTENVWLEAIANMITGIIYCPNDGAEIFYDVDKEVKQVGHTCWHCGKVIKVPSKLIVGKSRVLITPETKIYSHTTNGDSDMDTVTAEVSVNPNNASMWGIRNLTNDIWTYIQDENTQVPVAPGKTALIAKNAKIDFGKMTGEFN